MKTYIKSFIPAVALTLSSGLTSCVGDLDVTPIDPSTQMTLDPDALFNKCYALMTLTGNGGAGGDSDIDVPDGGSYGLIRTLFNLQCLTSDEAHCAWGDGGIQDLNHNSWSSTSMYIKGAYDRLYFGVTICNHYLEVAAQHDATKTAEVRFLRALYYYYLMDGWGDVGFRTDVSTSLAVQKPRAEIYAWIEKELLEIEPLLAEAKPEKEGEAGYGRADKAAAWLLLSRLYLNAKVYTGKEEYAKAKEYAKKVMDSPFKLHQGQTKNGWTAYQQLFMGDNGSNGASTEAVLSLIGDGQTTRSYSGPTFFTASTFAGDMSYPEVKDEKGAPLYPSNGTVNAWGGNRAKSNLVAKFFYYGNAPEGTTADMQAAATDDRALFWSKERTLGIVKETEFKEGFSVTKFNNYYYSAGASKDVAFSDADFFFMRSAEAYLTYAEADARLNGGQVTPEGVAAINALRNRAHAKTQTEYTLDQILDEWSREFYFELRRRIDLVRFDKFGGNTNYTWDWKNASKVGTNFPAYRNLFPIPDSDMKVNPNLKQNKDY